MFYFYLWAGFLGLGAITYWANIPPIWWFLTSACWSFGLTKAAMLLEDCEKSGE